MKGFNKSWCLLPSSPKVSVGDPLLLNKKNDRFPTTTLGNDVTGISGRTATAGFTLIELLVVVLIIGILSAVALPQYQVAVNKAKFVQMQTWANAVAQAEEMYYLANGKYSKIFSDLDVDICPEVTNQDVAGMLCKYKKETFLVNNMFRQGHEYVEVHPWNTDLPWLVQYLSNTAYPNKRFCEVTSGMNQKTATALCKSLGGKLSSRSWPTGTVYEF